MFAREAPPALPAMREAPVRFKAGALSIPARAGEKQGSEPRSAFLVPATEE